MVPSISLKMDILGNLCRKEQEAKYIMQLLKLVYLLCSKYLYFFAQRKNETHVKPTRLHTIN